MFRHLRAWATHPVLPDVLTAAAIAAGGAVVAAIPYVLPWVGAATAGTQGLALAAFAITWAAGHLLLPRRREEVEG